jgi:hypothetical protein
MKIRTVGSMSGALCVLLSLWIPGQGLSQGKGPAPAPPAPTRASTGIDPQCVKNVSQQAFCADPASDPTRLCAYLPRDSKPPVGYTSFSCAGQVQFDNYSWETLVALNWPADPQGRPCVNPRQPGCASYSILGAQNSTPRVWDYFLAANQVIPSPREFKVGAFPGAPSCGARAVAKGAPPVRVLNMIAKSDGSDVPDIIEPFTSTPLIDRNLNYTMYEILLNQDEATYITTNHLNTVAGQEAAKSINFPCGKLGATNDCPGPVGGVGSIEIKAAWRILDPAKGDDLSRYFWREQDLYISADRSTNHQAFCIPKAKLGLVALHILHKTASQPQWFWSTFEHRDNAPATTTPGNPAACAGPPASGGQPRYSYYRPDCPPSVCAPNVGPPGNNFLWSPNPPYARNYATAGKYGTQVVRCQPVPQNSPSSPLLDTRWQQKLAGTVWQNYQLVGTQWGIGFTGAPPAPPACFDGNVVCAPFHLLNSVQETYMQRKVTPTNAKYFANGCIQCHALATTVGTNQKPADFSFVLGRVGTKASHPAPPKKKP